MKLKTEDTWGKELLLHFETYIGTALFFFITVILTIQVVGRFIFDRSFAWIEEVSIIGFVIMTYCGVSGAILTRQNIKIDMVLTIVPFKVKKVMLVINSLIHAAFIAFLTYYFFNIIANMLQSGGVYSVTRLPKIAIYYAIAGLLVLTVIRSILEVGRLAKEEEKHLGKAKASLDLDGIFQEGLEARKAYLAEHPEKVTNAKSKKKKRGDK